MEGKKQCYLFYYHFRWCAIFGCVVIHLIYLIGRLVICSMSHLSILLISLLIDLKHIRKKRKMANKKPTKHGMYAVVYIHHGHTKNLNFQPLSIKSYIDIQRPVYLRTHTKSRVAITTTRAFVRVCVLSRAMAVAFNYDGKI